MIKVAIRADGNSQIGMGHIMRCLSLASGFKKRGHQINFICKYGEGIEKVKEAGFDVINLETKENKQDMNNEEQKLIAILNENKTDLLIVDSYDVTYDFFKSIKLHVGILAYIDDVNKFLYPVDIVINGNIGAEDIKYDRYSEGELFLLGVKYNLLKKEFSNLPRRVINKNISEVMITTGGSDTFNVSCGLLKKLLTDPWSANKSFNIIVGSAFKNKEELKSISEKYKNVKLIENVRRMSEIMCQSDLAISSGGSTLYELCACGTPTLAYIIADNQENIVQNMNHNGYVHNLGWYNELTTENLIRNVIRISNSYEYRIEKSEKMQGLVDGRGVSRIIKHIEEIFEHKEIR
ncbi:MAG: UDP-2,4-diacetamido-2,4,6-trideoxy-beta-L-altropyranose hydrolase [Clostridia bacterium]